MASNIVFNGVTYSVPVTADDNWGPDMTAYLISIASNALQKTGGTFTLTGEINFGATYGIKTPYIKSQATNPSGTGAVRLGNLQSIAWRNAANTADLSLTADATDALNFNGTTLSVGGTPVQTAITVSDTSTIDMTLSALSDVSAIVIAGSLLNSHINAAAAIAYSKLNLTGGIVNADLSAAAALSYSKLNLAGSIVNADISASAAISLSKLANVTASRALTSDASGFVSASVVTTTEQSYLSGVTSSIQTQLTSKLTNPMTTGGDLIYGGSSGAPTRLANGSAGNILLSGGTTLAPLWSTAVYPTSTTVNQILYSSSANTITGLAVTNLSALTTNGSGVPTYISGASANRVLRTDGTTISFSPVSLSSDVTGVAAIANGGTNNGSLAVTAGGVLYSDGTRIQNVGAGTTGQFLKSNGASAPTWAASGGSTAPKITTYTSGSGTHTFTGTPLWVRVRMIGGGAGGSGAGSSAWGNGTAGGITTCGTLTANGGAANGMPSALGLGGTASIGAGFTGKATSGGQGTGAGFAASSGTYIPGGSGASTPFGSGGAGGFTGSNGFAAPADTGGGGGGGCSNSAASVYGGYGGSSGGIVDAITSGASLTALGGSISYAVGAKGTGGSGGVAGNAGADGSNGVIEITEGY